ncbi:hypothetical protein ACFQ3B_05750 [Stackebrandtia endophytica]|nr:hypothetical protein [Stackebrandtia endophytica]
MKRALIVLYVLIVSAVLVVIVANEAFERESRDRNATSRVGVEFNWPNDPKVADPTTALRALAQAADEAEANVLRTSVSTFDSGANLITHYVYIGGTTTDLYDGVTLAEGRWLTSEDSRSGTAIVSSRDVDAADRVGVPEVFAGRYDLAFAPLQQAFDSLPVSGRYAVEAVDAATVERFLGLIRQHLVNEGLPETTVDNLTVTESAVSHSFDRMWMLPYVLVGLAGVLVVCLLIGSGKHIGTLRLVGYSTMRIWYRLVGRMQLVAGIVGTVVCLAISLVIPGADGAFLWTLAIALAQVIVLSVVITLVTGWGVIQRVRVTDLIKGSLQ